MVPPVTATDVLYAVPAVAPGSAVVPMTSLAGVAAAATARLSVPVIVCAVGVVESFTVM